MTQRTIARQVGTELTPVNFTQGPSPGVEGALEGIDTALAGATIGVIQGLVPTNDVDADHDIDFGTGDAVSSTGVILQVTVALVKQIDATWVPGTGVGGNFVDVFPSPGVQANQVYHLFIIRKDSDGSLDAGFDTSVVAANIPVGYTAFKRIGSVLTDVSANIDSFSAFETAGGGLEVLFLDPPLDVDALTSLTAVSRTLSVPTGIKVEARMNIFVDEAITYFSALDVNDEAPSITAAPLATIGDVAEGQALIFVRTNTAAQIRERSGTAGRAVRIATLGWTDARRD